MKIKPSILAIISIFCLLIAIRLGLFQMGGATPGNVLTWDAFGYYLYLPGHFIYYDTAQFGWDPKILAEYRPTGTLYQLTPLANGQFVMKYFLGISILSTPFFMLGHAAAKWLGYAQDGFSLPYQYAICMGAMTYALLGFCLLRKVLLRYFSEKTSAIVLFLIALATNYPQYFAVDSAMTHGFLFAIYCLQIWLTVSWHDRPSLGKTFFIGLVLGLATITRPTEAVMLFLPLLWRADGFDKWALLRKVPAHWVAAIGGAILGILPQILYWKTATDHWIHDVGSKWYFFNPWWRVLFGIEKGWFIYTPLAILMIGGLFFLKNRPFKVAITVFVLLNIWIVTAWSDWRYGSTFSCRALVQSYPVLSLPLAVLIEKTGKSRWKWPVYGLLIGVIVLNLFQLRQYNQTILHDNDMNFAYYRAIFLNLRPTPLDMSLLDTPERLPQNQVFTKRRLFDAENEAVLSQTGKNTIVFFEKNITDTVPLNPTWAHVWAEARSEFGAEKAFIHARFTAANGQIKETACRLQNGLTKQHEWSPIEFYFKLPEQQPGGKLDIFVESKGGPEVRLRNVGADALFEN